MSTTLRIENPGPSLSVQDLGRPGFMATGLSQGGAVDRLALFEAAALLRSKSVLAGVEMGGMGAHFSVSAPIRIALTGAPMQACLDGVALHWNASHTIEPGQKLIIGEATKGVYGYLTPAGGIATDPVLGSCATHLAVGIGRPLQAGDLLPVGGDTGPGGGALKLAVREPFQGGTIRLCPGPQTDLFTAETLQAFQNTTFTRSPIGNRQGVRFDAGSTRFEAATTGLASEMILPGDIQLTGDGVPYVLLAECQTSGGYPRIGSVIPTDLPRIAQTPPGARIRFEMLTLEAADRLYRPEAVLITDLRRGVVPLVRDPHDINDLLSYQLISGVVAGD